MTGKHTIRKRLQRFLLEAKSYLKHQWKSVLISGLITGSACLLETIISEATLNLLVLATGFTIGFIFIFVVKLPWVAVVSSLLSLLFQYYSYLQFLRQVALAALIGGCVVSLLDILKQHKK